jgi:hypothetical protein
MQPQAGSVRGMFAAVGRGSRTGAHRPPPGDSPYASQGDTLARERDTDCVARRSSLRRPIIRSRSVPTVLGAELRAWPPSMRPGTSTKCPKGKAHRVKGIQRASELATG